MRVIDTSAWIEWASGTPIGMQVRPMLPSSDQWLVPTIVQFELAKWLLREHADPARSNEAIAFSSAHKVAPLTTAIAVAAAKISRAHSLAAADAIIYATAIHHVADLVTCDAHFKNLPGVIYIPKKPN